MSIFDVLNNKSDDESEENMMNRLQYEWRSMINTHMSSIMNRVTASYKNGLKLDHQQSALLGQMLQTIEEQAELTQAMCKYLRACGVGQPTDITEEKAREMVIEEMADTRWAQEHVMKLMKITRDDLLIVNEGKIDKITKRLNKREEKEHEKN